MKCVLPVSLWVLKVLVLLVPFIPIFTAWPLSHLVRENDSTHYALAWMIYVVILSIIIITFRGFNDWFNGFQFAAILAVTIGFSGGVLGAIQAIGTNEQLINVATTIQYFVKCAKILAGVTYTLFFVKCFSAARAFRIASQLDNKIFNIFAKRNILVLRIAQHVMEVTPMLVLVWTEEHPNRFVPRWNADLSGSVYVWIVKLCKWLFEAVRNWCLALVIYGFEPVPIFLAEAERLSAD